MTARPLTEFMLAVDPGISESGWAAFHGATLEDCGMVRASARLEPIERVQLQLGALLLVRARLTTNDHFDTMVVERPMVYPGSRAIGDPNDIVMLAWAAGALGHGIAQEGTRMEAPLPRQWKGTVPKEIHHARLAKRNTRDAAMVRASTTKSLQHHVWDSVGLGRWQLERTRIE